MKIDPHLGKGEYVVHEEIQITFMTNKDETEVCGTDSSIRDYQDLKNSPLQLCYPLSPFSGRDDAILTLKVVL